MNLNKQILVLIEIGIKPELQSVNRNRYQTGVITNVFGVYSLCVDVRHQ